MVPKIIETDSGKKIVFFAKRLILDGEELSFDYKMAVEGEAIACNCGHPDCIGRMA